VKQPISNDAERFSAWHWVALTPDNH